MTDELYKAKARWRQWQSMGSKPYMLRHYLSTDQLTMLLTWLAEVEEERDNLSARLERERAKNMAHGSVARVDSAQGYGFRKVSELDEASRERLMAQVYSEPDPFSPPPLFARLPPRRF